MSEILPFPTCALPRFGSILVSGADARAFLQGQVSFDMQRLSPQRMELASCSSSQGRVQAVFWTIERADGILLILPAELVDQTVTRLRKYVMRAKAKVESGAGRLVIGGTTTTDTGTAPRTHVETNGVSVIRWPSSTTYSLIIAPATVSLQDVPGFADAWRQADVRAGLPQVYAATHEMFVAQMLNVDLLDGISFEKGCYTGQEIIARTHFRGTVKRRMVAFRSAGPAPSPGARILSAGAHAGDVVDAVGTDEGCELLAVIALAELQKELTLADTGAVLNRMPMPYEVTA
jgi:tRNA-modifying protein YgfZ